MDNLKKQRVWLLFLLYLLPSQASDFFLDQPRFEALELSGIKVINGLMQDNQGFIWMALQNGLVRFDGYDLLYYRRDPADPSSIPANYICDIHQDQSGMIWLGSRSGGLIRFDPVKNQFSSFFNDSGHKANIIRTISEDKQGYLWLGSEGGGLIRFDPKTRESTFYQHDPDDEQSMSSNIVYSMIIDRSERIWVGTDKGLNIVDPVTGKARRISPETSGSTGLSHPVIGALYQDLDGYIWAGGGGGGLEGFSDQGGLNRIDPQTLEVTTFLHDPNDLNSLSHNVVQAIVGDNEGRLWIGTPDGLNRFDGNAFHVYRGGDDLHNLIHSDIQCLYLDNTGVLWIGTFGGPARLTPSHQKFYTWRKRSVESSPGLNHNEILAILPEEENPDRLWVGTRGGGLNLLDRKTGMSKIWLHQSGGSSISHNIVVSMFKDDDGQLWLGTKGGGLDLFDPKTERFRNFKHDPNDPKSLGNDSIRTIVKHGDEIWLGTVNGVSRVRNIEDGFINHLHNKDRDDSIANAMIVSILPEDDKHVWLGSFGEGLNLMDVETGQVRRFRHDPDDPNSISDDMVTSLHRDRRGNLWIGVMYGGLNRLEDLENGRFSHHAPWGVDQGPAVSSILEDENGFLWLGVTYGIYRFDPVNLEYRPYSSDDGTQSDGHFIGAFAKDRTGRMYFGGINGVTEFIPKNLNTPERNLPIRLTDFRRFNKSVSPGPTQEPGLLENVINFTNELNLDYKDSVFSLHFAALSYEAPNLVEYAYMLHPFDGDWMPVETNQRRAVYTNLDPGRYTFNVRARMRNGPWRQVEQPLAIYIAPPWWRSAVAYTVYVLLFIGLLFLVIRWQRDRIKREQRISEELEKQVESRTKELALNNQEMAIQIKERDAIDAIIKAINGEVGLKAVTNTLLTRGLELFPEASQAALFHADHDKNRVGVVYGLGPDYEAAANKFYSLSSFTEYFFHNTKELAQGIYVSVFDGDPPADLKDMAIPFAAITLIMDIRQENCVSLASFTDPNAFNHVDVDRLARFCGHTRNAVRRAETHEALLEAQRELTESARKEGMADLATNVIHNVGNSLNSAYTAGLLIRDGLDNSRLIDTLDRLIGLLEKQDDLGAFFSQESKAQNVLPMLKKIASEIRAKRDGYQQDNKRLIGYITSAVDTLRAQNRHIELRQGQIEPIDLDRLIRQILLDRKDSLNAKDIQLQIDLRKTSSLHADRLKLMHILNELISNAEKSIMKRNRKDGLIVIKTSQVEDKISIEVTDNGQGIEDLDPKDVFNKGGGLHFCANTANEMQGSIQFHSEGLDEGASVTLLLPEMAQED